MTTMPRGLWIRCIAMVLGVVPLAVAIYAIDPPSKLGGAAILVYAAAVGIGIADYGAKHPDEFPTRPRRR
jgi:xanthine/uracil permease